MILPKNNRPGVWLTGALLCFFLFSYYFEANAQWNNGKNSDSLSWNFDEGESKEFFIGTFLSDLFTPQIIVDIKHIRKYLLDERFQVLRNQCGDMRTIDAIYLKSLKIADYNIARALFLSFMAVLEHRKVDVKMPIIGVFTMPLTFEHDTVFSTRINHLPVQVYSDSPKGAAGDRDKLQHFFGSAYISYVSEAPGFARMTGNLIEWGEALFIVGGTDDQRDKRANKHGECFGRDLLVVQTLLPSDYLTFQLEERK
jgi:hypothetical protein